MLIFGFWRLLPPHLGVQQKSDNSYQIQLQQTVFIYGIFSRLETADKRVRGGDRQSDREKALLRDR